MTRPGFTGCLNCLWLPTCATSYQPSCFKRCMTSRLDIRHDTHFLHTCQAGVYRSDRREPLDGLGLSFQACKNSPMAGRVACLSRPVSALAQKGNTLKRGQ